MEYGQAVRGAGDMNEMQIGDAWIYARLAASPELQTLCGGRIYRDLAPEDAIEPLVVYSAPPGQDVTFNGAARLQVNVDYTVKAITRGESFVVAYQAAGAIDAALHGAMGEQDGRQVAAYRTSPVGYTTLEKDTRFNHAGGVYRLNIAGS